MGKPQPQQDSEASLPVFSNETAADYLLRIASSSPSQDLLQSLAGIVAQSMKDEALTRDPAIAPLYLQAAAQQLCVEFSTNNQRTAESTSAAPLTSEDLVPEEEDTADEPRKPSNYVCEIVEVRVSQQSFMVLFLF